ncbi:hypothetical protein TorRG33x02_300060 [Trema orientale]|uniref:Transmembrane protein n=1 Tax=Trema orientale TaxID=63057 RepID=A0A2P5C292_TREOI|nr:hypothetical protein TorRG33x02_300060 [Trema orientale]
MAAGCLECKVFAALLFLLLMAILIICSVYKCPRFSFKSNNIQAQQGLRFLTGFIMLILFQKPLDWGLRSLADLIYSVDEDFAGGFNLLICGGLGLGFWSLCWKIIYTEPRTTLPPLTLSLIESDFCGGFQIVGIPKDYRTGAHLYQ